MRAVVVSGGKAPSEKLLKSILKVDDYLIGVDKGCNCLFEYDLKPDLILGDFDSADIKVIERFKEEGIKILKFNCDKDYTDTDLGYLKAIEAGADEVIFMGVTGTRIDHMLANVGVLMKAFKEGIKAEIIDDNNRMFLIDKETKLKGEFGETISFHALSDVVKNVCIKDGRYTLENYDMTLLEPRAICNEFVDKEITISFTSGLVMVIYPRD
ncbi:MAG: thiamine diphosphokinase [Clostridiaceae bacterium]|nr:thiamine diphosphokinase [Clostridiaceae bacterium]